MAGLDPATQCAHARCALEMLCRTSEAFHGRAEARLLGGRVEPGHDERRGVAGLSALWYSSPMACKDQLLILCARIGFNPPAA